MSHILALHIIKQFRIVRFLICFLRTPYVLIFLRGQIRRSGQFSVDASGQPISWITYPAIDYLDNIDFTGCRIFEYGSGASSLWWAKKAKQVTSVEMEKDWFDHVISMVPENVVVVHCPDGSRYPGVINDFEDFYDVIVIDGAERYQCALHAVPKLTEHGVIILDNTDWYPNTAKTLREHGFTQIDFHGFAPLNSFPSNTSLFFRSTRLLQYRKAPDKPVIGGNTIKGGTLDDGVVR